MLMAITNQRALVMVIVAVAVFATLVITPSAEQANSEGPPTFEVDSAWPTIPDDWVLGEVTSIAVDSRDHVWVLHRPRSIPEEQRSGAAPPVLEFDTSGQLLGR